MEFNTTIDQLTPEGAKLFTQAVDTAFTEKGPEQAYYLFSTVKQPKMITEEIFQSHSKEEIDDYRKRGYRFFDDPPFTTDNAEQYPWLNMTMK